MGSDNTETAPAPIYYVDGEPAEMPDALREIWQSTPADPVPAAVARTQALWVAMEEVLPDGRALDTALQEDADAALAATAQLAPTDPQRIAAKRMQIFLRDVVTWERAHPMIEEMRVRYGLTVNEVDDLFRKASQATL
jgi:hypothetical protein